MGFEYKKLSGDKCLIKVNKHPKDHESFLHCIQVAIQYQTYEVGIDATDNPAAIEHVVSDILKFQHTLGTHKKHLIIKGIKGTVSQAVLKSLVNGGVRIYEMIQPHGAHESAAGPVDIPLPPLADVEGRFATLKQEVAVLWKKKKELEEEKKVYTERLEYLARYMNEKDTTLHTQIKEIGDLEIRLRLRKEEVVDLQKKKEENLVKRAQAEDLNKKVVADTQAQYRDKKKVIDKKVEDLLKVREKMIADFKKKHDGRKAQLAQINQKK